MENVEALFILSQKKNKVLVDSNEFEYILHSTRNGICYWICRQTKKKGIQCQATAITMIVDDVEVITTLKVLFCYFFFILTIN